MAKIFTTQKKIKAVDAEKLYAEGASDIKIAQLAGVCPASVASWRHRTGRPPNFSNRGVGLHAKKKK